MPLTYYQLKKEKKKKKGVFSTKVNETIHKEISYAKFCVIVDETHDESMNKQMTTLLRFVDKYSLMQKLFCACLCPWYYGINPKK